MIKEKQNAGHGRDSLFMEKVQGITREGLSNLGNSLVVEVLWASCPFEKSLALLCSLLQI